MIMRENEQNKKDCIRKKMPSPLAEALQIALGKLSEIDLNVATRAAGVEYDPAENTAELLYIGRPCRLNCKTGMASPLGYDREFNMEDGVVLLDYLLTATGREPSGKFIGFGDMSGGGAGAFIESAKKDAKVADIERVFGKDPALLFRVLEKLSGERVDKGDAAVCIHALPRVPSTFVVWAGEDNIIPPAANVLFDASVLGYLPVGCIGPLAGLVAEEMLAVVGEK